MLILEPVFAAIFSALLGHALGVRGIIGAACLFVGILVVERGRTVAEMPGEAAVLTADVAH